MSVIPTPTVATTRSGATLPLIALPQTELLTIDTTTAPMLKRAFGDGADVQLLRLDPEAGRWVVLVHMAPGRTVPVHYHTGTAEVWTISGRWHYAEYPDQPQTAGCFLYEPGGSVHTLHTPADNTEDTVMLVLVTGANINFTEDGAFDSVIDAVSIQYLAEKAAHAQDITLRYIHGGSAVTVGETNGEQSCAPS
ncbi:2,4'-dihydroxyacetophenone dioxygenase family protein [Streptacidiphilus anmyonensis]|uniref:2,4'-dihydroxyacetophenone dioxygenase family protein n=1 Tax=Streptacidiphilus anmyonensis TaxID=405782 RepID=UPI0005AB2CE3|nr:2,4'-dihydroxyacetophenone dioxygenase family protein [Streptacidiphilus anmyonensis]